MILNGIITQIVFQKENGWGKYKIEDKFGKEYAAVGVLNGITKGTTVSLDGNEEDTSYGRQFTIKSVLMQEADVLAGARAFLCGGYIKGIGEKKANALLDLYGKDAVELFDTEEGIKKLTEVKGFGEKMVQKCLTSYEEYKKYKPIVLFLNGIGTPNQVKKMYEKYGDRVVTVLKKNPYRLQMDLDGFGFLKTDALALASGIKPGSLFRIMAAIKFVIETNASNNGHCFMYKNDVKDEILPLLAPQPKLANLTDKVINNAIKSWTTGKARLIKQYKATTEDITTIETVLDIRREITNTFDNALTEAIAEKTLIEEDGKLYTPNLYNTEVSVAKNITLFLSSSPVRRILPNHIEEAIATTETRKTQLLKEAGIDKAFVLTEEQKKAVMIGLSSRIAVISGGPGRGKTAIAEIIASSFINAKPTGKESDIIMLAPTGRAAQRITESTGYPAMTAHRAILMAKKNNQYPEDKLIIVDEASMIDIYLMGQILNFAKNSNIIFLGDIYQIASVGPGKVLKDMIDCKKIPCIVLEQGHRNTGTIAKNSVMINNGIKIKNYIKDEHFVYVPASSSNIQDKIVKDYILKVQEYGIENVMLCAAMRERGVVAVNKLNDRLQDTFTKGRPEAIYGQKKFRVGDRVMQTSNEYNFLLQHPSTKETRLGVFNGERGTVIKVIPDPEEDSYKMVVRFDDGFLGGYKKEKASQLSLAYATTLHKCQGSEADCMMMAYTWGDFVLLNRALFYTGETRAKKEFRFYGEEKEKYGRMMSAFDMAVSRSEDIKRNTALSERIIALSH